MKSTRTKAAWSFLAYRIGPRCAMATMFLAVSSLAFCGYSDSGTLPKLHLEVLVDDHFTPGVDKSELAAATDVWIKKIGVSVGLAVQTNTEVSGSSDLIRRRIDENKVDVLATSALEYLNLKREDVVEPVVTISPTEDPKGKVRYLILTNQDSGLTKLESLKGKTVLTYTHSDQTLSRMWMDVLLQEHHLASSEGYFHSIAKAIKPSVACLPVFFGKADACLIDESSWKVLKELNPQLGSKLVQIAESPAFVETIIALHANRREYRAQILNGMLTLPNTPGGRQVLLFFRSRNAYAISKSDLREVVDLRRNYLKFFPPETKSSHLQAKEMVTSEAASSK